jgi:hypothetical protein
LLRKRAPHPDIGAAKNTMDNEGFILRKPVKGFIVSIQSV